MLPVLVVAVLEEVILADELGGRLDQLGLGIVLLSGGPFRGEGTPLPKPGVLRTQLLVEGPVLGASALEDGTEGVEEDAGGSGDMLGCLLDELYELGRIADDVSGGETELGGERLVMLIVALPDLGKGVIVEP